VRAAFPVQALPSIQCVMWLVMISPCCGNNQI